MGGRAWLKYQGSLQILAIFQGFGGCHFVMHEVILELNLSFKNSHIGGLHKKIRALVGDHSMKSDVIIELNLSFKNSHIGGLHKKNQGFSWRSFYEV